MRETSETPLDPPLILAIIVCHHTIATGLESGVALPSYLIEQGPGSYAPVHGTYYVTGIYETWA